MGVSSKIIVKCLLVPLVGRPIFCESILFLNYSRDTQICGPFWRWIRGSIPETPSCHCKDYLFSNTPKIFFIPLAEEAVLSHFILLKPNLWRVSTPDLLSIPETYLEKKLNICYAFLDNCMSTCFIINCSERNKRLVIRNSNSGEQ